MSLQAFAKHYGALTTSHWQQIYLQMAISHLVACKYRALYDTNLPGDLAGVIDQDRHANNILVEILPNGYYEEIQYVFGDVDGVIEITIKTPYHVWSIDYGSTRNATSSTSLSETRRQIARRPTSATWGWGESRLSSLPEYKCM